MENDEQKSIHSITAIEQQDGDVTAAGEDTEDVIGQNTSDHNGAYNFQYYSVEEEEQPMEIDYAADRPILRPSLFSFPNETSQNDTFHNLN